MPKIAAQHQPGHWANKLAAPYTPTAAWPEDCLVQWGEGGIVFSANGTYRTAFFEAFPANPDTFIRGEGASVADAEAAAYAKLQKHQACPGHDFERRHWRSGAGACRHCGLFNGSVFEPLETCTVCGIATYHTYGVDSAGAAHWFCDQHAALRDRDAMPNALDKLLLDDPD